MGKYEGPEKRYIRRHHVNCISVMYRRPRFLRSMSEFSRPCELSDINWRGIRFYARHKMRKGMEIDVVFECPLDVDAGNNKVPVRARVVWQQWSTRHKAWRTGVQFINLVDELRNGILEMIDAGAEHERRFRSAEQELV